MQVPVRTPLSTLKGEDSAGAYLTSVRLKTVGFPNEGSVASYARTAERRRVTSESAAATAIPADQLYAEFNPLVRRLIREYGDNPEIRHDLEGEIYYRFCVLLKAYDPSRGVPLRPYLVRMLTASIYSFARQYWRRQSREISLDLFAPSHAPKLPEDPTRAWDDAIDLSHVKQSLPEAIAKLSARQRKVVVWRYFDDLSFEDIAARLGVQTSTARSLLRHALNHLRRAMKPA